MRLLALGLIPTRLVGKQSRSDHAFQVRIVVYPAGGRRMWRAPRPGRPGQATATPAPRPRPSLALASAGELLSCARIFRRAWIFGSARILGSARIRCRLLHVLLAALLRRVTLRGAGIGSFRRARIRCLGCAWVTRIGGLHCSHRHQCDRNAGGQGSDHLLGIHAFSSLGLIELHTARKLRAGSGQFMCSAQEIDGEHGCLTPQTIRRKKSLETYICLMQIRHWRQLS